MRSLGVILVLVVMAVLAGGCSVRPRCEVYHFTSNYPADLRPSARAASAKWAAFSGFPMSAADAESEDRACSLSVVESGSQEYRDLAEEMGTEYYAAHDTDGSIHLATGEWHKDPDSHGRVEDFATSILMHEMAHEYGLGHVEDGPDAVMGVVYPGTNLEFNAQDRAELDRVTR